MSTQALAQCLQQTLVPATRKQAESQLLAAETTPGFAVLLLQLIGDAAADPSVRASAALYLKNFIKRWWKLVEGESDKISPEDRATIKSSIVQLMSSVPASIQTQLSDAVAIIADNDYPHQWTNLMPDLISRLSLQNIAVNVGVLQTVHAIFKRWRHQFRSDALFTEIVMTLDIFAEPYLQFFKAIDAMVDSNRDNKAALTQLLEIVLLLEKIFYSCNCHDLYSVFEESIDVTLNLMRKYLSYSNPVIDSDPEEAGPIEKVRAMACENIELYARMYVEDFKRLPEFIELVWTLLTTTTGDPKNDVLVSRMLDFLTSIVKRSYLRQHFQNPATLQSICGDIILPNMRLRTSDEELFEDDAVEYIRRDLEGTDSETRRSAATELVRALLEEFPKEVTAIFSGYISKFLENYEANRVSNWQSKDTALYLITSLSAKSVTAQTGAVQTNEYIPILPVFAEHVLPDLQAPIDGAIHPIIKVDAIKYLTIFRSQLTKEQLINVLPHVDNHLSSTNYVVHTWAAHAIERIFAVKVANKLLFAPTDAAPFAPVILSRLFERIEAASTPEKLAENDYLMKCVMRMVATVRDQVTDIQVLLGRLTNIIKAISKNPSNPKFNHFVFESLSLLIRFISLRNPAVVADFESFLTQPFVDILQQQVSEFEPYVFQIFSQMLRLHPGTGLPPSYQSMLQPLLTPAVWENQGNVPALVGLLQVYIIKGSAEIVAHKQLAPFLGVCHKLLGSRLTDNYGFDLLMTLFEHVPIAELHPFLKNVFIMLLTRLTQSKTTKFTTGFLNFLCFLFALDKPDMTVDTVVGMLDSLQPTPLFGGLLQSILIPALGGLVSPDDRKRCAVGMTRLLTTGTAMMSDTYFALWPTLLTEVINMLQAPLADMKAPDEDPDVIGNMDLEEVGYQASFVRLGTVAKPGHAGLTASVADPMLFLAQSIVNLNSMYPAKIGPVIQHQLPNETAVKLQSYMHNAGLSLIR
ncbi:importin-alpha export receptor [Polyrhizophydium stewartii]|uniref:Importin-alpha export receptor n=1 Tax=Polyrhizophydium stewartii TaxID=2732419 RepID=A0ABR4MVR5_9FUNG